MPEYRAASASSSALSTVMVIMLLCCRSAPVVRLLSCSLQHRRCITHKSFCPIVDGQCTVVYVTAAMMPPAHACLLALIKKNSNSTLLCAAWQRAKRPARVQCAACAELLATTKPSVAVPSPQQHSRLADFETFVPKPALAACSVQVVSAKLQAPRDVSNPEPAAVTGMLHTRQVKVQVLLKKAQPTHSKYNGLRSSCHLRKKGSLHSSKNCMGSSTLRQASQG